MDEIGNKFQNMSPLEMEHKSDLMPRSILINSKNASRIPKVLKEMERN